MEKVEEARVGARGSECEEEELGEEGEKVGESSEKE